MIMIATRAIVSKTTVETRTYVKPGNAYAYGETERQRVREHKLALVAKKTCMKAGNTAMANHKENVENVTKKKHKAVFKHQVREIKYNATRIEIEPNMKISMRAFKL